MKYISPIDPYGLGRVNFNTCDGMSWVELKISQPNKVKLG